MVWWDSSAQLFDKGHPVPFLSCWVRLDGSSDVVKTRNSKTSATRLAKLVSLIEVRMRWFIHLAARLWIMVFAQWSMVKLARCCTSSFASSDDRLTDESLLAQRVPSPSQIQASHRSASAGFAANNSSRSKVWTRLKSWHGSSLRVWTRSTAIQRLRS